MPKKTKLEISRYQQISSSRSLENAYYKAVQECCEIETENKLFVRENGDLYTASEALVDWYYKACFNSLADDITIIIDHDRKHARLESDPEEPDMETPAQDTPKQATKQNEKTPPKNDKRKQIYQQIKQYNDELTDALDKIESIPPENTDELKTAELDLLNKVSSLAVMKKHLYDAMKSD